MKTIKTTIIALLSLVCTNVWADVTEITQAFANGNISKIETLLNSNVDVNIQGSANNSCDKYKAKTLISDFFRRNRPTNYTLTNKTEKGKSTLIIGKLYTNSGEFSLLLQTIKEGSSETISQVKVTQVP